MPWPAATCSFKFQLPAQATQTGDAEPLARHVRNPRPRYRARVAGDLAEFAIRPDTVISSP